MVRISSNHKRNKKEINPLYLYIQETEKKRKKEYENFLEYASERLSFSKDIIAGQPMITMSGNHYIRVSNYRSVTKYSTECVILCLWKKNMNICGSRLFIESLRKEEIIIVGNITNIFFEEL